MNNPLTWKREHQIALACAIAIGLFFGFIAGLYVFEPHGYSTGDLGVASTGQIARTTFILDPIKTHWRASYGLVRAFLVKVSRLVPQGIPEKLF
jgi:hypothetical protein